MSSALTLANILKMAIRAYKKHFNDSFSESLNKLRQIKAEMEDGSAKEISLDPDDGWVQDPSKEAAHLTIEFPKGISPKGKIVVGYMGEDYQGEPVSFPVDRKIHVIRGRILEAVKGKVIQEGDSPLLIRKGELAQVDASDDSVIVIDLTPNEPQRATCDNCEGAPCTFKECSKHE